MAVPEASLNFDYEAVLLQNDIGPAGQAAVVQAKTVAEPMQRTADRQFGRSVPAPYEGHNLRAFGLSENVSHRPTLLLYFVDALTRRPERRYRMF